MIHTWNTCIKHKHDTYMHTTQAWYIRAYNTDVIPTHAPYDHDTYVHTTPTWCCLEQEWQHIKMWGFPRHTSFGFLDVSCIWSLCPGMCVMYALISGEEQKYVCSPFLRRVMPFVLHSSSHMCIVSDVWESTYEDMKAVCPPLGFVPCIHVLNHSSALHSCAQPQ